MPPYLNMRQSTSAPTPGTRIAVTGSEGFVGRHLRRELQNRGCEVVGVDLPGTGAEVEINLGSPATRPETLPQAVGDVFAIIYMAATITRGSSVDALARSNLRCIAEMPAAWMESYPPGKAPHLIACSTYKMYGPPRTEVIDPADPPQQPDPHSYGSAKFLAEHSLRIAAARSGFTYGVVRPTCIYGPGQHLHNAIPRFLTAALAGKAPVVFGDGTQLRDDVFAPDLAWALAEAALRRAQGFYHAGGGRSRTVAEVAELCARAVAELTGEPGQAVELDPSQPAKWWIDQRFDLGSAQRDLGYVPISFLVGLKAEAAWIRDGASAHSTHEYVPEFVPTDDADPRQFSALAGEAS